MKLRLFKIQNYKSLKDCKNDYCADLHTLIGRNSIGKTSIFDAINLLKRVGSSIPNSHELVSGGIDDYDHKIIRVDAEVEVPLELQKEYLIHYFGVEDGQLQELISRNLAKTVKITIETNVYGTKVPNRIQENVICLTGMAIQYDEDFFPIILKRGVDLADLRVFSAETHRQGIPDDIKTHLSQISQQAQVNLGSTHTHGNSFHSRFLNDLQQSMKTVSSIRESTKKVKTQMISDESQIGERGTSLINLMDTMLTNETDRYFEIENYCKSIFPDVESIRPEKLLNNEIRIVLKKTNFSDKIDLVYEGAGIDQLLIIIWIIATSKENTMWFLDEPELHLHPGAQKLVYDFLKDETQRGKQIIIATHSMVFMYKSQEEEISLLVENEDFSKIILLKNLLSAEKQSGVIPQAQIRNHVYKVLGYDPTFSIEPRVVVMVEGKTDEEVFKAFSSTLGKPIDSRITQFIPIGNKRMAEQFSPILTYALSGKKSVIILDNDKEAPTDIIKKVMKNEENFRDQIGIDTPILNDENFCKYSDDAYSIEYYLLDGTSICEAAGKNDNGLVETIDKKIKEELSKPKKKRTRPKELLKNIWADNGFGPYNDSETPKKIAGKISKEYLLRFPEIVQIIDRINS